MDFLTTLRHRHFTKLWVAQVLSQVAQNLLYFALIIEVFNLAVRTHYANVAVGLLVIAFGIPSIFFAAVAGAYVDHWNRKTLLIITNALRTVLVLLYLVVGHSLVNILILAFLISTVNQFFVPAEAATIPRLVPQRLLMSANSLFVFSLYTSFIVGFSASGPIIASLGNHGPFLVTSLMFALATLLVLWLPRGETDQTDIGERVQPRLMTVFRDNWRIIKRDRWISFAITQLTITQTVVGVVLALAPALSLALLHEPLQRSSWYFIFPAGLGMVAGVLIITTLGRRWSKVKVLEIGLVIAALALTGLGLSGQLYHSDEGNQIVPTHEIAIVVAILVFALGMLNAVISATAQTMLQENTDDAIRGKVFGSLNMFINIAATLPVFVAGLLADLFHVTRVVTVIGILIVAYGLIQLRYIHGRLHQLDQAARSSQVLD